MAQAKQPKAQQTVRQRAQTTSKQPKVRRLNRTASSVAATKSSLKRAAKPLAKPFQFKPVRMVVKFLATVLLLSYARNSFRELRQVAWPNRKETTKLTVAVFIFAIIFGSIIALTDYGLDKVFRKILL